MWEMHLRYKFEKYQTTATHRRLNNNTTSRGIIKNEFALNNILIIIIYNLIIFKVGFSESY